MEIIASVSLQAHAWCSNAATERPHNPKLGTPFPLVSDINHIELLLCLRDKRAPALKKLFYFVTPSPPLGAEPDHRSSKLGLPYIRDQAEPSAIPRDLRLCFVQLSKPNLLQQWRSSL